jgi:3-methylfumaryl-CoA hydratase
MMQIDDKTLGQWVGKTTSADDLITPHLIRAFCATLELDTPDLASQAPAPLGMHWCLAPSIVPISETGEDGHPKRGGFLPPVPLPRRMWAGGRLTFHDHFRNGDTIERVSTILSVKPKVGRSGTLCFVVVEHKYISPRGLALVEEHDIVYRSIEENSPGAVQADIMPKPDLIWDINPTSVLLFRYSALTFNSHRIHYDRDYVTKVEKYQGLIVHGPLQATYLLHLAAKLQPERRIKSFAFRAVKPLFDIQPFRINALMSGADAAHLWICDRSDGLHMQAQVIFEE